VKSEFVSPDALAYRYGLNVKSVYTFIFNNKDKKYISGDGYNKYIDVGYLEDRKNDIKRLWLCSHDYYYHLMDRLNISEAHLGRVISEDYPEIAWGQFLNSAMWNNINDRSILAVNIRNEVLVTFITWCEEVIPQIEYRLKGKVR